VRSRGSRRATAIGVGAILLLWPLAAGPASASTGTDPGRDRAAAVQTVLDRVLGPGTATVVVSDTVRTSSGTSTSIRWGSGVAAATTSSKVATAAGSSVAASQQNLVGSTATSLVQPAGTLVRQSISVAVDRAHLGSTSVAAIGRLVRSAAGVVPSRGDRLSIVVARFARPAAVVTPAVTPLALLLPYAVPAMWVVGALLALLILVRAVRGPRRRAGVSAGA
jgi:flagellar M-ring protein FliF